MKKSNPYIFSLKCTLIFHTTLVFLFFMASPANAASLRQNSKVIQDTNSEIIIRSLTLADWKEFRNLRLKALKENPIAYGIAVTDESDRSDEDWKTICQDAYNGKGKWYFIAEHQGQLVGILGAVQQNGSYMSHLVEIVGAYVDPHFRRSGVMKQLFCALKSRLQETAQVQQLIAWVTLHEYQTGKYAFESFNFKYAGKLSRVTKYEGLYYDCCWLEASLRDEEF